MCALYAQNVFSSKSFALTVVASLNQYKTAANFDKLFCPLCVVVVDHRRYLYERGCRETCQMHSDELTLKYGIYDDFTAKFSKKKSFLKSFFYLFLKFC